MSLLLLYTSMVTMDVRQVLINIKYNTIQQFYISLQ